MVKVVGPMMSHYASGTLTGPAIYSSSLRNRKARQAKPAPPPPLTPPYVIVTGTLTPDATGFFLPTGIINGFQVYSRQDDAWHIWGNTFYTTVYTRMTQVAGSAAGPSWLRADSGGVYPSTPLGPWGGSSGTAHIVLIT